MQIKALLLSFAFSSGAAVKVRAPVAATPAAVPVPAAPTATLPPVPEKLSCKKLDTCLAKNGGDDAALKTCIMRDLGEEKGSKVWGILTKAKLASKKPSLALLKTSEPGAYTAVLQALFSQNSKVLLVADLCAITAPKIPEHLRSPEHVKVPKKTAVALPKPPNGHPGTASNKSAPAAKEVSELVKVPDAPIPHGHPQAAAEDEKTKHEAPATCKKLDVCLAKIDHAQYLAGYQTCITGFCQELHGEKEFKKADDSRTALCDKSGLDAMDVLAKAAAEAKTLGLPALSDAEAQKQSRSGDKTFLALMETKPSFVAFRVVERLFSKSLTSIELEHACRV